MVHRESFTDKSINSREDCVAADSADPLADFRSEFILPADIIYLDGNSLGAMPQAAAGRALSILAQEWGQDLIASWNTNEWFDLPTRLGDKLSRLLGGSEGECVMTDTTSINIFKVLAAAINIQRQESPNRRILISERANFPTDLYMAEGIINLLDDGYKLLLIDDHASLNSALDEHGDQVAVVMLTHVNYRSGEMWEMNSVTRRIHSAGALAVWDLCHSVGAVPVNLTAANADFAVGCTYKYLNGGPGSPAFVWVAEKHHAHAHQPLSGWWGHASPFKMETEYEPAAGIRRFRVGTQPIISLGVAEVGIDIALRVDQGLLREKSLALTSLFIQLVQERLPGHPLTLITPRDEHARGSHVSFRHPEGFAVMQALIAEGVIGDYREPEVLRFGCTPLYTGYEDVWNAVETLRRILDEELWRAPKFQERDAVT